MRSIRWPVLVAAILAISVYVSPVYADSIGPNDCAGDGCFGGVWTLEFEGTATADVFQITYTVDTSGMTTFGAITEVAFKVSSSIDSVSIVSSPATWGTTVLANIGLAAGGCSGGGNGFACSTGDNALAIGSATYQWVFLVDIDPPLFTGDLATCAADEDCASIKANGTGNGQVLSQNITLQPKDIPLEQVPEPTTLLLVGTALAGVGVWGRKRWLERMAA